MHTQNSQTRTQNHQTRTPTPTRRLEHDLTMARLAAADGEQRLEAVQSQVGAI
jgi:hypothetical protein